MVMLKKVHFILFCFVFTFGNGLLAQVAPPELRCIAIEDNKDITLTWIPTLDPMGQFVNYQVYSSVNGVTLAPVIFTNRLQNTFTLIGAGFPKPPPLNKVKFWIITEYNDGGTKLSLPSDTLCAMELQLTLRNPNTSGDLKWNLMRTNPLATWDAKYNIKRKLEEIPRPSPPRNWDINFALIDYANTNFSDSITRCLRNISYQIELKDASGCVSKSNIVEKELKAQVGAAPMTFDRITVNNSNGQTNLYWTKHPDPTVVGYIIIYLDPSGDDVAIDTVSSTSFNYADQFHSALPRSQCYVIVPIDSCGKTTGAGTKHCTIHLDRTFDECAGEVYLSWTPYTGWPNGLEEYSIYMALNGDTNYTKIGSVLGEDTIFTVKNVNALDVYSFYVIGKDKTGRFVSFSNVLGTKFNIPNRVKFLYLRSASLISENEVKLKVFMDRKAPFKHINIYRSTQRTGPFRRTASVRPPTNNIKDTLFDLMDTLGRPAQINYVYYLEVIDTCGQPVNKSNWFRTLFLSGTSDKYVMENELKWSANISVDSTATDKDVYSLYRGVNRSYAPDPIRSLWSNTLEYLDDFSDEINKGDEFCYQLKLAQASSDTFVIADTSLSNELCFKMEPDIFIPNSFTPNNDGKNESWRPKTSYVVPIDNYNLQIYDRWGKLAFETTNPLEGWSGKRNEGFAAEGVYLYHLEITTVHGSKINRKGNFNLVR